MTRNTLLLLLVSVVIVILIVIAMIYGNFCDSTLTGFYTTADEFIDMGGEDLALYIDDAQGLFYKTRQCYLVGDDVDESFELSYFAVPSISPVLSGSKIYELDKDVLDGGVSVEWDPYTGLLQIYKDDILYGMLYKDNKRSNI